MASKLATGQLQKLTISGYKELSEAEAGGAGGIKFEAFYNPENASSTYTVTFVDKVPVGDTTNDGTFKVYSPGTFTFDLLIDGTGASVPHGKTLEEVQVTTFVADEIQKLKDAVYYYQGDKHRPNYVVLNWGKTYHEVCVLTSMAVTYTLFHPDGNPLRAKIKCDFKEAASNDNRKAKQDKQSPDITHVRTVRAGDSLPLMCHQVYGDSKLYLQVARANKLRNHRSLTPGQKIFFPPLITKKA